MKTIKIVSNFIVLLVLIGACKSVAQNVSKSPLRFEVLEIYPPLSITYDQVKNAETLEDLHRLYKDSWVKEYISVSISSKHSGVIRKASSINYVLSEDQKRNISTADAGSEIAIEVKYIPNNNLKENDIQEFNSKFIVVPTVSAEFPRGEKSLKDHLKVNAIDKIVVSTLEERDLAIITFTIDENGNVIDPNTFGSEYHTSNRIITEELLMSAITNMPSWKPAEYYNGKKARQEFALTVGNLESCVIHLLNTHRLPEEPVDQ